MIYCGVLPRCRSTRGLLIVKLVLRAVLPALLVVFAAGCGSDEPQTKVMSDADRAKEMEQRRASQEASAKKQAEEQMKNKGYSQKPGSGS